MYSSEPRPQTRHGHSIISFAVLLLFLTGILVGIVPTTTTALGVSEIIDLSNAARVGNDLPAFSYNEQLATAAQAKAEHMKSNQYFEHTAPDGTTGWYFIEQSGYVYISAGENLAATNEGSSAVVNGWMNSPGHRANLLSKEYLEVGYGIVYPDSFDKYRGIYFVVALYGIPKNGVVTVPLSLTNTPNQVAPTTTDDGAKPKLTQPITEEKTAVQNSGTLIVANADPTISIDPRVSLMLYVLGFIMLLAGIVLEIRHYKHKPTITHI